MTTVTGKLIGATNPQRVEMRATLVDVTGKAAVGYVVTVPGEVVRPITITPENDGDWTVELTPNSLIQSDAGDTLWAIQEGRAKDGTPINTYVAVPSTGGPYWVGSIRAELADAQTGTGALTSLVQSVNGQQGVVVLNAAHVGADPTGTAASTTATHAADTTDVHGIANTAALETTTGAQAKADAAQTAATTAAATDATSKVNTHASAADPHGDRAWADTKFATQLTVTALNTYVDDTAARIAAVENGTAWLAGINSSGPALISGADLTVKDNAKGYRFRRGGSALDLEATGADLLISNWSGTGFNGTQRAYFRLSADAQNVQVAGPVEFVTGLYGAAVHKLDPGTGVASLGGKNGLAAIRLAGFKNSAGAPTTGTWEAGDVVLDSAGAWHLCSASGTPGTWT